MWKNLVNSEKLVHSKFSITFWQRDKQDTDILSADIDDNKITMNQISSLSNKKRRKLGF